ncbi:MAG: hypothetical protein J5951_07960 [Bacteroidales bacterium]|nr:hypothetical protein [Bacteroidales bacterium]
MFEKSLLWGFGAVTLLLLSAIIVQQSTIRTYKEVIKEVNNSDLRFKEVLKREMTRPLEESQISLADSLASLTASEIIIIVPDAICHACFQSLIQHLIEREVSRERIAFFLPESQKQLERVLRANSFESSMILPYNGSTTVLQDILVAKKASNGWQRCYFRYSEGDDSALEVFLNL